jgi:hypothetical protein
MELSYGQLIKTIKIQFNNLIIYCLIQFKEPSIELAWGKWGLALSIVFFTLLIAFYIFLTSQINKKINNRDQIELHYNLYTPLLEDVQYNI